MTDVSAPPPPPMSTPYPFAPPPAAIARPPRKWLGSAGGWLVFLAFTFFWFCNVLFDQVVLHTVGLSPNSLVLGGFGMTAALVYTLAYRLRPQDGISVVRLGLAFVLGGLFSTELAIFIEAPLVLALGSSAHAALIAHSLAGVIEEACKILAVVIAARGLVVRNARTGLFLGGAVGLGFAAFEDMRYASAALTGGAYDHGQLWSVIQVTFGRDLIGPLEHPIMTALLAAALFAATRNGRFRITGRVVLVYLGVAAAHGLVDTAPDLFALVVRRPLIAAGLGAIVGVLIAIGLGIVWLVYSRRLRRRMLADESGYAVPAPVGSGYAAPSPVGSGAVVSSSDSPPTGTPSQ
jgi:RsiW-degrading membrane proteinase PrsW (M82 family)